MTPLQKELLESWAIAVCDEAEHRRIIRTMQEFRELNKQVLQLAESTIEGSPSYISPDMSTDEFLDFLDEHVHTQLGI